MKKVSDLPSVSPRHQGEINAQNALLAAIIANSNDAILSYSIDGMISSWNSAAERIYGYTADEIIGQPFAVLVPSEMLDEAAEIMEKIRKEKPIANYETVRLRKDGSSVPISITVSPIYDSVGAVIGGSTIARDLTERQKFETQESLMAAIVASSNDAISSSNLDGVTTSWNPGAERIFGYSADEIIGQPSSVFVHFEKSDESADNLVKIRKGQSIENFETVRIRKDGRAVSVSMTISPIIDRNGAVNGATAIYRDITEIKKFQARNDLLASIVANSNDAISSFTIDGVVTSWNAAAERIYGYTADEIVGGTGAVFLTSEKAAEAADILEKIRNGQSISHFETMRLRKDGSAVPISLSLSPICDLTGALTGLSEIWKDMTELKEFQMRNDLLAAIVANSNDAISSYTLDGIITSWNPAAERTYGYTADEIIGQPFSILVPSENLNESADIMGMVRKGQSILNYETVRLRKDGSVIPVMQTISPIYDSTGAAISGSTISRDMTTFKKSEQKFFTIVDLAPDAIVIMDRTGTMTIVNSQAEEIFGYSRDEMVGQPVGMIIPNRFQTDDAVLRDSFIAHHLDRPRGLGGGIDLHARRKDGREFPVAVSLSPIDFADGTFLAASIRDVTDHKNMIQKLKEIHELRNEFVVIVAHDLRSPITSISGYAQELINEWDAIDDSKRIEYLQVIVRNTEQLVGFVEEVLQVARIEAGEFAYDIRPFDIRLLVQRAVDETASAGDGRRFKFTAPRDFPAVLGDENRHWQVLTNLLSNAVKFSTADEPIVVGLSHIDDSVQVAVTDRGIGIATDDLSKLFEKFGRVGNSGILKAPGNGLGLYICKTMVEAQGGQIWCESSPGQGSTFTFTIPVAR